jgi:hypothetical protein
VELVEARVVPVAGKLNLELQLFPCDRQAAHRAVSSDTWPTPRPIRCATRELAALDRFAGLLA